jgi:hypothetical protein
MAVTGYASVEPVESTDRLRERLLAVASLGVERRPGPDRPWTGALPIEQDLLASVEAILATFADEGSLVRGLDNVAPPFGLGASAALARALVLGSARGDAPAAAAARTLRDARPEARAAAADALSLAQSAAVGPAVVRLLDDAPAPVCAAALGVLRFRRQAPYGVAVLLLAHPDTGVAAAAARCLGVVQERRAAAAVLRHILSRDPADALALPVAETLLALGDPAGLVFVRDKLETESSSPSLSDDTRVAYLRLLGMAGDAADLELFFRSVEPGPRDAAAVGWFGHPDLLEWLLGSLDAANDARRTRGLGGGPSAFEGAAARALGRILGNPSAPDIAKGAPSLEGLPVDAGFWRRVRAARLPGSAPQKLRFGRPYTPAATLDELEIDAPPVTRTDAALELSIVSRGGALLETGDYVARQRAALDAARAAFGGEGAYLAGTFPGSRLAER